MYVLPIALTFEILPVLTRLSWQQTSESTSIADLGVRQGNSLTALTKIDLFVLIEYYDHDNTTETTYSPKISAQKSNYLSFTGE